MNLFQTLTAELSADLEALKNSTSSEIRKLAGLLEHAFQNAASTTSETATPPPETDTTVTPPTE